MVHAGLVETLNERFAVSKGAPLELDGQTVFGWWVPDNVPAEVSVRFESRQGDRRQGIALSCDGGQLAVEAGDETVLSPKLAIWADSAPEETRVVVQPRPWAGVRRLGIYNIWEGKWGQTDAWIGNAGVLVERLGSGPEYEVRLRCSCGFGAPDFDDLVVRVACRG